MPYYRIIKKTGSMPYETQVLRDGGEWKTVQGGTLEQCEAYKRQMKEINNPPKIEIVEEYEV